MSKYSVTTHKGPYNNSPSNLKIGPNEETIVIYGEGAKAMSDIIDRLENMWMEQEPKLLWTDMEAITEEAADEITRLRAEHKMAFEAVGDVVKANDDLRTQIESAEKAYVRLDTSMNKLKAAFRVIMLRAFPHMSHDEIDAEIEAAIRESGDE